MKMSPGFRQESRQTPFSNPGRPQVGLIAVTGKRLCPNHSKTEVLPIHFCKILQEQLDFMRF